MFAKKKKRATHNIMHNPFAKTHAKTVRATHTDFSGYAEMGGEESAKTPGCGWLQNAVGYLIRTDGVVKQKIRW